MDSSPTIGSDGTIYVGFSDTNAELSLFRDNFFAINPDGSKKWEFKTSGDVDSSPAIGNDGTIYVGSEDNYLYAINPNGSRKWRFKTGDYVYSSPAIGNDGTIYFGSYDNNLYAINPDGSKKWAFRTGDDVYSSCHTGKFDGTIYVGSDDHNLYAINPDGSKKWNFKTRFEVSSSPAIGSDGTIYVGSEDNYLYAIEETYKDIKIITDTRDDAEILLEEHTAKHGGFGIRTWSAEKGNLKSFDETKGMYDILSPAEFADRFDLDYPIKQFYALD